MQNDIGTVIFLQSFPHVLLALRDAISALGYQLDPIEYKKGIVVFRTGSKERTWLEESIEALLGDVSDTATEIRFGLVERHDRAPLHTSDWAEAKRVAGQVVIKMTEFLPAGSLRAKRAPNQPWHCPYCNATNPSWEEKCTSCGVFV